MDFRSINFILLATLLTGCSDLDETIEATTVAEVEQSAMEQIISLGNPFFSESSLSLNYSRFDLIKNEHYLPAFERGMAEHLTEIETIISQIEPPTFENTIVALEISGQLYARVANVFFAMSSAHTNDEILNLQQRLAPDLASYDDSIMLNRKLFARILYLY